MATKIFVSITMLFGIIIEGTFGNKKHVESQNVYPCALQDLDCISKVFEANSNCSRTVLGKINRHLTIPEFKFNIAHLNTSYTETNLIVKNLHRCFISDFHINPVTDKVVLSLTCRDMDLEADRFLVDGRSHHEPTHCRYHIRGKYPLVHVTVTMPSTDMELLHSTIHAEVSGLPRIQVQSLDSGLTPSDIVSKHLTPLDQFEDQAFASRGYKIARRFIQSRLCDYGYIYD